MKYLGIIFKKDGDDKLKIDKKTLSFSELVKEFCVRNQATSITKLKEVLYKLGLKTKIYKRDSKFSTKNGTVVLHPFRGTQWTVYNNKIFSVSYGCPPPSSLSDLNNK